jgi:hypothetical protein
MRSAAALPALLALALVLPPATARAEVTADKPLVEQTGHTLRQGEWKVGIRESSYGLTDRLQLNSYLLAMLAGLNVGLKYKVVDAPNLALSTRVHAGASVLSLLVGTAAFYGAAGLDATFPMGDRVAFSAGLGWTVFHTRPVTDEALLGNGRLSYFTIRSSLQWVMRPRHVFFLDLTSPTSWYTAVDGHGHDFDMLDFANGTVGYQFSHGMANLRLNLGWGPSLFGRGPTASLDFYLRFGR